MSNLESMRGFAGCDIRSVIEADKGPYKLLVSDGFYWTLSYGDTRIFSGNFLYLSGLKGMYYFKSQKEAFDFILKSEYESISGAISYAGLGFPYSSLKFV
jgi:hypothetical protein